MQVVRGWIRDDAGVRVPLSPAGIWVGRSNDCRVVVDHPSVSRRHALILPARGRVLVLPLGKIGVTVRGTVVHALTPVESGDPFFVGPARLSVELAPEPADEGWILGIGDRRYAVDKPVFSVGGRADEDDLVIDGWPERFCVLYAVDRGLLLELADPGSAAVSGGTSEGDVHVLGDGACFSRGGVDVRVLRAAAAGPTAVEAVLPTDVALELVPQGALLRIKLTDERTVFLPQKRGDLVAALLSPGAPFQAGDWVDDDVLAYRVWGREAGSRTQLNVLLYRTRRVLTEAGLDGPALLQRASGGRATRFRVAAGARVTIL